MVGAIMLSMGRSYGLHVWHKKDIGRSFFGILPGYSMAIIFDCLHVWDSVLHVTFVEHCGQPFVCNRTMIHKLFHQNIVSASTFAVLQ